MTTTEGEESMKGDDGISNVNNNKTTENNSSSPSSANGSSSNNNNNEEEEENDDSIDTSSTTTFEDADDLSLCLSDSSSDDDEYNEDDEEEEEDEDDEKKKNEESNEDAARAAMKDPTQKILKALTHKEAGNSAFKSGNLPSASRSYRKGTITLKKLHRKTPKTSTRPEEDQIKSLLITLQTNLSMVCFKQDKHRLSRDVASKALEVHPDNVKALYRRAMAHKKLGCEDLAMKDFRHALKSDPENRDVKRELNVLRRRREKAKEDQRRGLKKAFSSKGKSGGSVLYEDKAREEELKKEEKRKKEQKKEEERKKRKAEWEDECVKRMSGGEEAISFEDWDKARRKKEEAEEKRRKKAKKAEERRVREEKRKARENRRKEMKKEEEEEEEEEDGDLTEKDLSAMRGYKKTREGKTTSYFHRELTDEQKAMIGDNAPQKLYGKGNIHGHITPTTSDNSNSNNNTTPTTPTASKWNQAGTWEERDCTDWCRSNLKQHLSSAVAAFSSSKYSCQVQELKNFSGEASVAFAGGKKRYIYDYSTEVLFRIIERATEQIMAEGSMKLPDVSSTVIIDELEVEFLGWKKGSAHVAGDGWDDIVKCRDHFVQELKNAVYAFVVDFNAQF